MEGGVAGENGTTSTLYGIRKRAAIQIQWMAALCPLDMSLLISKSGVGAD